MLPATTPSLLRASVSLPLAIDHGGGGAPCDRRMASQCYATLSLDEVFRSRDKDQPLDVVVVVDRVRRTERSIRLLVHDASRSASILLRRNLRSIEGFVHGDVVRFNRVRVLDSETMEPLYQEDKDWCVLVRRGRHLPNVPREMQTDPELLQSLMTSTQGWSQQLPLTPTAPPHSTWTLADLPLGVEATLERVLVVEARPVVWLKDDSGGVLPLHVDDDRIKKTIWTAHRQQRHLRLTKIRSSSHPKHGGMILTTTPHSEVCFVEDPNEESTSWEVRSFIQQFTDQEGTPLSGLQVAASEANVLVLLGSRDVVILAPGLAWKLSGGMESELPASSELGLAADILDGLVEDAIELVWELRKGDDNQVHAVDVSLAMFQWK